MIKILVDDNQIEVSGHANSDNVGHDLVCCAVSTIMYTCTTWFKDDEIIFNEEPKIPRITLTLKTKSKKNQNLIALAAKQLEYLSVAYKKYIKFEKK